VIAPNPAATASLRLTDDTDALFTQRLTAVRQARGFGAQSLSLRLGQHKQFVAAIEKRGRRVSVGEGLAICQVLGVDLAQMLDPAVPVETLTGGAA
jgi:transcriptional regulator with XRE-family HTH domain